MWSISTLVTPKGDDQMADIQAERIQPPHRRCVVVKKPTVDFQNFLTTEKYLGGWQISTKCSNCTHLFWLKLIALSHYQSSNLWWKVRLSLFKTSEALSKWLFWTAFSYENLSHAFDLRNPSHARLRPGWRYLRLKMGQFTWWPGNSKTFCRNNSESSRPLRNLIWSWHQWEVPHSATHHKTFSQITTFTPGGESWGQILDIILPGMEVWFL